MDPKTSSKVSCGRFLFWVAALAVAFLAPLTTSGQDSGKKKVEPFVVKEADVERMNQAMAPGEMHRLLAQLEGEWTYASTAWMVPDTPPVESTGTANKKMILGGRWLEEHHQGEFLGAPFEGRSFTGWDNLAKEFRGVWIDNVSTGLIESRGRLEADGKTFTLEADILDPLTERRQHLRMVTRIVDADHHEFEYHAKPAGQPERKEMVIRYTRKGKS